MRLILALLLAAPLVYAQLCIAQTSSSLELEGGAAYYVQWRGNAVVYNSSGAPVALLGGSGRGLLAPALGGLYASSTPLDAVSCVHLELLASRLKPKPTAWGPSAPLGVAYYGFADVDGVLYPLPYVGESAKGCFSLGGLAAYSYSPLGRSEAYSIQLNAYVEAGGGLYWVQALVRYRDGAYEFLDNVWNMTGPVSSLAGIAGFGSTAFLGSDEYYFYVEELPPLKAACLEVRTVGRYVYLALNGTPIDRVELPGPARIVVEPQVNARGLPIDLELVVGGYGADMPVAEVLNGSAELTLYIWNGTTYAAPPAAWNMGLSTQESAVASAQPSGRSAVVESGAPRPLQLWADLPCIYFLNGTAQCGGERLYLVELKLPNGTSLLWAEPGPLRLALPSIRSGGALYISAEPAVSLEITGPVVVAPAYRTMYLVNVSTPLGPRALWVPNGTAIGPTDLSFLHDGVLYLGEAGEAVVDRPLEIRPEYIAIYNGTARDLFGLPSPLSVASLTCGGRSAYALAGPTGGFSVAVPATSLCSARLYAIPISVYVALPLLLIFLKSVRRRNLYKSRQS
ncbi:MAG: thermopsin family protease [Thermoproteus sp.]|nr:thermopsin family protease [Thermoproteus sp.]MDT7881129.1 thermopsin family protease [Thermoproteus sp.]